MNKIKLVGKIGVVSSSVLLAVMLCGTKIATLPDNFGMITQQLGQTSSKIESTGESTGDTEYFKSKYTSVKDLNSAAKDLVNRLEAEGAVLLKNENNALPLAKKSKISLLGYQSIDPCFGGRGSANLGAGGSHEEIDLIDGLSQAIAADGSKAGFDLNQDIINFYKNNPKYAMGTTKNKVNDAPWEDLVKAGVTDSISEYKDAAIFTISRSGGENQDLSQEGSKDGNYLALSSSEKSVLKGLNDLKKSGKLNKIIVLINSANPIEDFADSDLYGVDAALWIGTPGVTGFKAIGNIIAGSVNPSGHLSDTYYFDHDDNPVNKNFGAYKYEGADNFDLPRNSNGVLGQFSTYDVYQEGVYVGYRYAETRYADVVTKRENAGAFDYATTISQPFGFGESYTDFEFSNFKVNRNKENDTYEVTVDVKNIGTTYSGKDAVQIYLQKPYNDKAIERGIEVPAVELVGFAKTSLLAPGATETVKVTVNQRQFAVYDATKEKTYILNDGDYYLAAGMDAHDALNNILAAQGYKKSDGMTDDGNKSLTKKITLGYDKNTYSISKATGNKITNLFDEADINKYDGKTNMVTYVSRNNWTGTLPTTNVKLVMTDQLVEDLLAQEANVIAEDNVKYPTFGKEQGLMLIDLRVDSNGNPIAYDDQIWDQFLDQLTWEETVSLVSSGARKTPALPKYGKPETLDHNGPTGLTQSYGGGPLGLAAKTKDPDRNMRPAQYQSVGIIASTYNHELFAEFGNMLGEEALWAGYSGFYGVGINTHRSAYEGRAFEYFSEDPFLAGTVAAAESAGLEAHGCHAYIKHFALNEQESQRQGVSLWANEQTLREIYLRPFEMAVVDGGAYNAMASFTRIGVKYNPGSHALMTDWLRGECGMRGFVVTDMYKQAYEPEHMPTFIMAGCDLPDGDASTPYPALKSGHGEFAHALRESAHRILYSTLTSNAMNGMDSNTRIVKVTPAWAITTYTLDAVVGAIWVGFIALAIVATVKASKRDED